MEKRRETCREIMQDTLGYLEEIREHTKFFENLKNTVSGTPEAETPAEEETPEEAEMPAEEDTTPAVKQAAQSLHPLEAKGMVPAENEQTVIQRL